MSSTNVRQSGVANEGSSKIESERLVLFPFEERFLTQAYVSWLNDSRVNRFSNQRFQTHTIESCREYVKSFEGSSNRLWAIVRSDDEAHLGNVCATIESEHKVADISILIGEPSAWGKGIGEETWRAVCGYLFIECGIRKVTGGTLAVNRGMIRVMEKCGMSEEGRRRRQYLVEGEEVDIVYFGLFADEFLSQVKE